MQLPLSNLHTFIYSYFGIFIIFLSMAKGITVAIDLLKDELNG